MLEARCQLEDDNAHKNPNIRHRHLKPSKLGTSPGSLSIAPQVSSLVAAATEEEQGPCIQVNRSRGVRRYISIKPYESKSESELTLSVGDVVFVSKKTSKTWWMGRVNERCGRFPPSHVKRFRQTNKRRPVDSNTTDTLSESITGESARFCGGVTPEVEEDVEEVGEMQDDQDEVDQVERVVDHRVKDGALQLRVRWRNATPIDDEWFDSKFVLHDYTALVADYTQQMSDLWEGGDEEEKGKVGEFFTMLNVPEERGGSSQDEGATRVTNNDSRGSAGSVGCEVVVGGAECASSDVVEDVMDEQEES